jgi:hypothetical protein
MRYFRLMISLTLFCLTLFAPLFSPLISLTLFAPLFSPLFSPRRPSL